MSSPVKSSRSGGLVFVLVVLVAAGVAVVLLLRHHSPASHPPSTAPPSSSPSVKPIIPPPNDGCPPPSWLGFNVMAGGYTITCADHILGKCGGLKLRNALSSYITDKSPWESDLLVFLLANPGKVELYTCLKWNDASGLNALQTYSQTQPSFLTHVQINGSLGFNPTEADLTTSPDFDLSKYLSWLEQVDRQLDSSVVLIIPFHPYIKGKPLPDAMNQILVKCASLQTKKGRPFGLEGTVYPFWNQQNQPDPNGGVLTSALNGVERTVQALQASLGFSRLDPIVCESGWPSSCSPTTADSRPPPNHGPTVTSLANAQSYWKLMNSYKPINPNFRLYYWQFHDVNNGDGCGAAWGIVDKKTCWWI